ncbi:MAG: S8 family serine peptidase [Candidatus Eremiobacteraeota bacterium]|nr:S8 family serine peptidase [Candidatus Eremiobacteraeota bacterium]
MKSFYRNVSAFSLIASTLVLTACGGGGGGGLGNIIGGIPSLIPTPFPSSPPVVAPAGTSCLAAGQSAVRASQSAYAASGDPRISVTRIGNATYVPDQLAIQYKRSQRNAASLRTQGIAANAIIRDFDYPQLGVMTRFVRVDPAQIKTKIAELRAQADVESVERVPYRYITSSQPYFPSDPYFSEPSPPANGVAPYYENATSPGQWDMHAIGMENVFGYSRSGNALPANPNALGSPSIRLAIVDTGADVTLADIAGSPNRIVRTGCFITPASGGQTVSTNVSDFDGHGTNVTGIAAADINGFGFVGVAPKVSLMLYRIFPSAPSTGCSPGSTDPQCGASLPDEVAAINDAVANGANVINLSLGSSSPAAAEQNAIANAINSGVTVVAASGNGNAAGVGQPALDYPAAYPGVIAVGASAIDDSGIAPVEKISSYSNYQAGSTTWGLVAPGGDPTGSADSDFLHWIQNTYSLRAPAPSQCRAAQSPPQPDFFGESGNCSALIAGTSQATPHVAGAAALLMSVTGRQSPAQVKAALFASAHDLRLGDKQGAGRLNVYNLIGTALGDASLPAK